MIGTTPSSSSRIGSQESDSRPVARSSWPSWAPADSEKETFVRRLFDALTPRYDLFNRLSSLGWDAGWRRRTVERLKLEPGERLLDLASGTGDLAAAAVRHLTPLGQVTACDLSGPMLRAARRKMARHPLGRPVRFAQGRAESLPFAQNAFAAATMGFALRNVSDLGRTFEELYRVLKGGGRLGLLEFGRPKNPVLRMGFYLWLWTGVPLAGMLTTGRLWPFVYLRRSIQKFLPPEAVMEALRRAGFQNVRVESFTAGVALLYTARKHSQANGQTGKRANGLTKPVT